MMNAGKRRIGSAGEPTHALKNLYGDIKPEYIRQQLINQVVLVIKKKGETVRPFSTQEYIHDHYPRRSTG